MNELCVPGPGTRSGGQANQAQAPRKWLGVGKTNEEGAGGGVGGVEEALLGCGARVENRDLGHCC